MTANPPIVDEVESLLRRLAEDITRPHDGECLCCYVARLLDEFPCDGTHRHALRYQETMAPRATALLERLSRIGACCCDCELFMNGYQLRIDREHTDSMPDDDFIEVAPPPPCSGVRRGSIKPCANWVRLR